MMDGRGFYLTVSSGEAVGNERTENTNNQTGTFQIREQLLEPIDTTQGQELEVGLVRFSFPRSWYTIEDNIRFHIRLELQYFDFESDKGFRVEVLGIDRLIVIEPPKTHIDLENDILLHLNKTVSEQIEAAITEEKARRPVSHLIIDNWVGGADFFKIEYDKKIGQVIISDPTVHRRTEGLLTAIGGFEGLSLWRILGFSQFTTAKWPEERDFQFRDQNTQMKGYWTLPIKAEKTATLASTSPLIRIYAPNLIYHQRVADTFKPLLEMIPVIAVGSLTDYAQDQIKQSREIVTYEQSYPLYKRLRHGYINEIIIDIRDINDFAIPQISGSATIILHIRPCRQK